MKLIMKGYEIELINYCLRIVINHYKKPFDLNYKSAFFDRYSQISIGKLITARTTDELVENLKETEYYAPLKKIKDTDNVTLYDYNLALDLYYYTSTWKEQKKILKKSDLELFMRDRGSKIDLLNIQWIYRAKKYYNMKPADIYLMLIPIHYKLSTELVKDMVEAPGVEEFENGADVCGLSASSVHGRPAKESVFGLRDQHLSLLKRRRIEKADNRYGMRPVRTESGRNGSIHWR